MPTREDRDRPSYRIVADFVHRCDVHDFGAHAQEQMAVERENRRKEATGSRQGSGRFLRPTNSSTLKTRSKSRRETLSGDDLVPDAWNPSTNVAAARDSAAFESHLSPRSRAATSRSSALRNTSNSPPSLPLPPPLRDQTSPRPVDRIARREARDVEGLRRSLQEAELTREALKREVEQANAARDQAIDTATEVVRFASETEKRRLMASEARISNATHKIQIMLKELKASPRLGSDWVVQHLDLIEKELSASLLAAQPARGPVANPKPSVKSALDLMAALSATATEGEARARIAAHDAAAFTAASADGRPRLDSATDSDVDGDSPPSPTGAPEAASPHALSPSRVAAVGPPRKAETPPARHQLRHGDNEQGCSPPSPQRAPSPTSAAGAALLSRSINVNEATPEGRRAQVADARSANAWSPEKRMEADRALRSLAWACQMRTTSREREPPNPFSEPLVKALLSDPQFAVPHPAPLPPRGSAPRPAAEPLEPPPWWWAAVWCCAPAAASAHEETPPASRPPFHVVL